MKNTLIKFGIQINEIAMLLLVPVRTVHSWFNRNTSIPRNYSGYFIGIDKYAQQNENLDLDLIYDKWASNYTVFASQKKDIVRKLSLDLKRNELALLHLYRKKTLLLKRLHFSENYPNYLSAALQENENQQLWCSLLKRSSGLDLGALRIKMQKLEEKKAAVTAMLAYWAGVADF